MTNPALCTQENQHLMFLNVFIYLQLLSTKCAFKWNWSEHRETEILTFAAGVWRDSRYRGKVCSRMLLRFQWATCKLVHNFQFGWEFYVHCSHGYINPRKLHFVFRHLWKLGLFSRSCIIWVHWRFPFVNCVCVLFLWANSVSVESLPLFKKWTEWIQPSSCQSSQNVPVVLNWHPERCETHEGKHPFVSLVFVCLANWTQKAAQTVLLRTDDTETTDHHDGNTRNHVLVDR